MGATAPTPPSICYFCFLWPVDMRKEILSGTAKLETTPLFLHWFAFCYSVIKCFERVYSAMYFVAKIVIKQNMVIILLLFGLLTLND